MQLARSSDSHSPAEDGEFSPSSKAERKRWGHWEMGFIPDFLSHKQCDLRWVVQLLFHTYKTGLVTSPGITLEQRASFERLLSSVRPTPGPGWWARLSVGGPLGLFSQWFCFIGALSETVLW